MIRMSCSPGMEKIFAGSMLNIGGCFAPGGWPLLGSLTSGGNNTPIAANNPNIARLATAGYDSISLQDLSSIRSLGVNPSHRCHKQQHCAPSVKSSWCWSQFPLSCFFFRCAGCGRPGELICCCLFKWFSLFDGEKWALPFLGWTIIASNLSARSVVSEPMSNARLTRPRRKTQPRDNRRKLR